MLKLAVKHYLKSIGDHFFVPNPDYAEWVDVDCLDIAIKRKPKWFWQNNIYTYDHFGINDLLDSPIPSDKSKLIKSPEPLSPNFVWTSKHSIKTKLGGKIASLLSLDLSSDDILTVSINLEGLMKQSIDFAAVAELLKTKKVDLNSKYVRHVAYNKYNVICLVTQYIYLTKQTEIKVTVNWNIDQSFQNNIDKASIGDSGNINSDNVKSITFDAGTRLAFDFAELLINPDGSIELLDRSENFTKKIMISDPPDLVQAPNYCAHVTVDKQVYDIPDGDAENKDFNSCLDKMQNNNNSLGISKNLLEVAFNDRISLKQFELFLMDCQQIQVDGKTTIDISSFNIKQIENTNLLQIIKQIGFDIESLELVVKSSTLDFDIIKSVILKIQSIFYLELPFLKNIQSILETIDACDVGNLTVYLRKLKNSKIPCSTDFEYLIQDKKIKLLLMSIGLTKDHWKCNKYFEPVLVLLCGL